MGYAPFLFPPINVQPLAELLQNAGAEQILPALSLRVAGLCCRGASAHQMAQARAKPRLKNSRESCCAVTGLFFGACSNERVFLLRGTSWGAFIGDRKHAEKFAADISLAE